MTNTIFVQLRDARVRFASDNKFPKRYQKILAPITAHSDDEYDEERGLFVIKTLSYRSKNAGRFFRQLDRRMIAAAKNEPGNRRRIRRLPKNAIMSKFTVAPKGLPLDFYDVAWFKSLGAAQQQMIPDRTVAFLPDAKQSLLPKDVRNPDESLNDKVFNRKYWEILAEPYGVLPRDDDSSDSDATTNANDDDDEESEGIDLEGPSPDASEDEYFEEGEAGDLYDDDSVASGESEADSEYHNQSEDRGDHDEDVSMGSIPEADAPDW